MKNCPHNIVIVKARVKGYWISFVKSDGSVDDSNIDEVQRTTLPKFGICEDCGKKVPNPQYKLI